MVARTIQTDIALSQPRASDVTLDQEVLLGQVAGYDISLSFNIYEIRQNWEQLQRAAGSNPFQDFNWLASWHSTCSRHQEESIVFVHIRDERDLIGILPLYEKRILGSRVLSWMTDDVSDYCQPLLLADETRAPTPDQCSLILSRVAKPFSGIDAALLLSQPAESEFSALGHQALCGESHHVTIDAPWATFYASLRSAKTRSRFRQKRRQLAKRGRLSFRSVSDAEDRDLALARILDWKSNQLDHRGSRNPFRSSGGQPSRLVRTIHAQVNRDDRVSPNQVRIFGLFVDDEMIAGCLTFVANSQISVFVNAYDPDAHRDCSPGNLLLLHILEVASRSGISAVDLMRGAESYKTDWCSSRTDLFDNVVAFNWRGEVLARIHMAKQAIKQTLVNDQRAMTFLQSANRNWRICRENIFGE